MDEKEFNKEWKDGEIVKYAKEYDENAFWEKLKKFGRKAGIKVCYAALLLYYVLKSPLTSGKDRAKIIGALGYFLLPMKLHEWFGDFDEHLLDLFFEKHD